MSPEAIGGWMLVALLATIFIGFPIAFTLIILGLVFGYWGFGDTVFNLLIYQVFASMKDQTLAQVPLFESLSRRHLKKIAEHADEVSFRENETIVEADQPGGTFFVIVEGEVKVLQNERVIARAVPGEFFGEISLLDGGPRTASVVAATPVVAVRLFKSSFDKVVREEPGVAAKILAVVAGRLRQAEKTVTA